MNYERLLRKARAHPDLWTEGPRERKLTRIIHKCKAKLTPAWDARAKEVQRKRGDAYMHSMT